MIFNYTLFEALFSQMQFSLHMSKLNSILN